MKLNEKFIKNKVLQAIKIKPTYIVLMRKEKTSNGMRGGKEKKIKVAELDVFFDDFKRNNLFDTFRDSGHVKKVRSLGIICVTEGFQIKEKDYFSIDSQTYVVTYPGEVVKDVYIADIERVNNE
ncbi:hypothetical protein HAHI6034_10890 [Hathewaya histolytica]|uniref:Uncharacterized protein n=1 Tax=Hathewaya histolytica TaxID=1498 RepID=A0A4U9RIW3_HATHI|nr:hypothetical protein [Hathewaya histolytica]VTQ88740.1 Uncharacterised protein [Hathewaya histolytica]